MSTARWASLALEEVPAQPKVRWGRADLEGSVPVVPKVRWARLDLAGAAAVIVAPLAPQTVEPESVVTVSAMLAGGGAADSWTFRRVSGPVVGIEGSGATRTFTAPSAMPPTGATVVIGVTATVDGTTSPEVTCTVTVLPQVSWVWTGTAFVGARTAYVSA